jgi:hypothetical protein
LHSRSWKRAGPGLAGADGRSQLALAEQAARALALGGFRPKLDNPNEPTVAGKDAGTYVANERYKNVPGSVLRFGNLPAMINADVHSGEDVVLTASGPGSERVRGQMDNTEVFRVMVEALSRLLKLAFR